MLFRLLIAQVPGDIWSGGGCSYEWDVWEGIHQIVQRSAEWSWCQVCFFSLMLRRSMRQIVTVVNKVKFALVGQRWMCASWASSLAVSGWYLLFRRDYHCKFVFFSLLAVLLHSHPVTWESVVSLSLPQLCRLYLNFVSRSLWAADNVTVNFSWTIL